MVQEHHYGTPRGSLDTQAQRLLHSPMRPTREKKKKALEALKKNSWILKINASTVVSVYHIRAFFTLWMLVHNFRPDEHFENDIVWKHTTDGLYSAASASKAQCLGMILSLTHGAKEKTHTNLRLNQMVILPPIHINCRNFRQLIWVRGSAID